MSELPDLEVEVRCGECGSEITMVTCQLHDWVLGSYCQNPDCLESYVLERGCEDCVRPNPTKGERDG